MKLYQCTTCKRKYFTTLDNVPCCSSPHMVCIGEDYEYEKRELLHFPKLIFLTDLINFMLKSVKLWIKEEHSRRYEDGSITDVPKNNWKIFEMDNPAIVNAMVGFIECQNKKSNSLLTFEENLLENYKIIIWFEDEDDDFPEDTQIFVEIKKKRNNKKS